MSSGTDNQVDWTAAATPSGDSVGPGLARRKSAKRVGPAGHTRSSVMDTLLGESDLAAYDDASGSDPYNTTGKFVRR